MAYPEWADNYSLRPVLFAADQLFTLKEDWTPTGFDGDVHWDAPWFCDSRVPMVIVGEDFHDYGYFDHMWVEVGEYTGAERSHP